MWSPHFVLTLCSLVALVSQSSSFNPAFINGLKQATGNLIEKLEDIYIARKPQNNSIYDFIIVGAGSSGCALANRLSENPNWRVALIEAGTLENILHLIPVLTFTLGLTDTNWGFKSVPQKHACFGTNNNQCAQPRGKVLGGTSSINFMIYNRGNKRDFDKWAAAGNPGWSYEEVLPYFLKSENAQLAGLESSPYHNHSGPLGVSDVKYRSQLVDAFVAGAQQAGHQYTDYNGESQMGVSYVQSTTKNGKRSSAYQAFLRPIRQKRTNLEIFPLSQVTRVLIDPVAKAAYGIEFKHRNIKYVFKARKEVLLSAGSFKSPQLLMLSGIGPADNLQQIGVPLIKELPVGKLLYDHMSHLGLIFTTNTTGQTIYPERLIADLPQFLQGSDRTRLSSIGSIEALTFLKVPGSQTPADFPDMEFIFTSGGLASDDGLAFAPSCNFRQKLFERVIRPLINKRQDHFTLLGMLFHPKSVGSIWLDSSDPTAAPVIDPKWYVEEEDVELMLQGVKEAIRISKTPALQKIGARVHDIPVPGCEQFIFGSDDYWRCSIRTFTYSLHHQVATTRMGSASDPTTVVNSQLKVHGIGKLRVVDTGIIPFPPTAHTNAAAMMIGEKAADLIKAEWENI